VLSRQLYPFAPLRPPSSFPEHPQSHLLGFEVPPSYTASSVCFLPSQAVRRLRLLFVRSLNMCKFSLPSGVVYFERRKAKCTACR
jgi:hypothetical protein